jgi:hypothetical protein
LLRGERYVERNGYNPVLRLVYPAGSNRKKPNNNNDQCDRDN